MSSNGSPFLRARNEELSIKLEQTQRALSCLITNDHIEEAWHALRALKNYQEEIAKVQQQNEAIKGAAKKREALLSETIRSLLSILTVHGAVSSLCLACGAGLYENVQDSDMARFYCKDCIAEIGVDDADSAESTTKANR